LSPKNQRPDDQARLDTESFIKKYKRKAATKPKAKAKAKAKPKRAAAKR
jgi:hypothetical protein